MFLVFECVGMSFKSTNVMLLTIQRWRYTVLRFNDHDITMLSRDPSNAEL